MTNDCIVQKTAILQSNYIPWKGYFDMINSVDNFVLYDDVQFTRRDWRNRNKIKTPGGSIWLTIPVEVKGKYHQLIKETRVANHEWAEAHWQSILHAYGRAEHFPKYKHILEDLYREAAEKDYLSEINLLFISSICKLLNIETKLHRSSDFQLAEGKSERLLSICQQLNSDEYISGPAAKNYLDTDLFERNEIRVTWFSYQGYPEYQQLHPPFEHSVSIIDLLVHTGEAAKHYINALQSKEECRHD